MCHLPRGQIQFTGMLSLPKPIPSQLRDPLPPHHSQPPTRMPQSLPNSCHLLYRHLKWQGALFYLK